MKIKGWEKILSFTYLQTVKTKSFKISTVVICIFTALLCAAINLLPAFFTENGGIFTEEGDKAGAGGTGDKEPVSVSNLYICSGNELGFELMPVEGVKYLTVPGADFSEQREAVILGETPDMLLYIYGGAGEDFYLTYYYPENDKILPKQVAQSYANRFTDAFTQAMYFSIGVDEADLPLAQADIHSYVAVHGEESWIQEILNVAVPMGIALIFYMFIVIYSQLIAQSMATEKSSRVIELLITSARPLAIITGKILGTLLVCVTQVAIIGMVGGAAFALSAPFALQTVANAAQLGGSAELIGSTVGVLAGNGIPAGDADVNIGAELASALPGIFNIGSIIAVMLTFLLGFIFFALLAGLVGASVSRMEDLTAALQPLMLIAVAGFFLSYLPPSLTFEGDMDSVITFSHFFPISSPFALPPAILMGQMGAAETVIAIVMLTALTLLTAMLTAKVYEGMILYSGNRLKVLQILKMAKKDKNQ